MFHGVSAGSTTGILIARMLGFAFPGFSVWNIPGCGLQNFPNRRGIKIPDLRFGFASRRFLNFTTFRF